MIFVSKMMSYFWRHCAISVLKISKKHFASFYFFVKMKFVSTVWVSTSLSKFGYCYGVLFKMHNDIVFCVTLLLSVSDIKTKEIILTLDLGKPSRHGMVVVVFKLREQQGHKLWCIFSLLKKLLGLHWDNRFQALHIQMRISHSAELVMIV